MGKEKKFGALHTFLSSLFTVRIGVALLTIVLLLALCVSVISANQTTLEYSDGTQATGLAYDVNNSFLATSANISFGSSSYFDRSRVQSDVYARICHEMLVVNSSIDFVYKTESGNTTRPLFNLPVLVTEVYNQTDSNNVTINCTVVDTQFSVNLALYPGYVNPRILTNGVYYYVNNSMIGDATLPTLNGSIIMNLTVDSPPKSYWFTIPLVQDSNRNKIYNTRSLLLTSLVNAQNHSIVEAVLRPNQILNYTGTFSGGERLVVNGITVFSVNVFQPCGEITQTGYYLLNNSMFNLNTTCINITNVVDVKLNFAGELLDGDADSVNGSFRENQCAVIVKNARNITLEGLATQQFYNGVCVINSTVTIYGNSLTYNRNGLYATNDSIVYVGQTTFTNDYFEANATNRSTLLFSNNTFTTAQASGIYYDTWLNDVPIRPTLPVITGYTHINQFLEVRAHENTSWAKVSFNYGEPLPNNVQTNQIYIYKYNGSYDNISTFDNTSNTTSYAFGWTPGANWSQLFTLVSPQEHSIYTPNVTTFSIFAPFGHVVIPPGAGAGGSTGSSGGGGGAGGPGSGGGTGGSAPVSRPTVNFTDVIQLKLTIPPNVTLMQGEIANIAFTLENLGTAPAYNVNILADVPRGWKSSTTVVDQINPGESISSIFSISVYEKVMPADYYVPVSAIINGDVVVSKILKVSVVPRGNLTRLLITEYNPIIDILPNSQKEVTFKAKNIGDYPLENVQILLAPNDCIKEIVGSHDFAYGEEKEITYRFVAGAQGNCQYTLKFVEGDTLVDFVPVTFQIRQLTFVEQTLRLMILGLIVGVWFTVAVVIAFKKRRPPYQLPPTNLGGSSYTSSYTPPNYSQYYRGN